MSNLAGGFIAPSPPPSSTTSSSAPWALPHPRNTPLKPGGSKESSFIRYVDQKILHIQRRFAKRDTPLDKEGRIKEVDEEGRAIEELPTARLAKSDEWNDVAGYGTFSEAAKDVEEVLGVTWVSGTPALQIPYLISLALLTNTIINAFPAAPRAMFRLLGKLDHAFASLLQGKDLETGAPLPGFDRGARISGTEKVRIKSLVERSRICVMDVMSRGDIEDEDEEEADTPPESDLEGDLILDEPEDIDVEEGDDDEDWHMNTAKVYDKTLVELGDSMAGPAIGIRTEGRSKDDDDEFMQ